MYQTFEHTADLGLRVEADSLSELFVEAARGLMSLLVDHPERIEPRETRRIEVASDELDFLLFDWLNELLYRFDTEGWLGATFEVSVKDLTLSAVVRGETLDRDRHQPGHEVKAITYHDLAVIESPTGEWSVEVIVDI